MNTICSGVFFDRLSPKIRLRGVLYQPENLRSVWMGGVLSVPPSIPKSLPSPTHVLSQLWQALKGAWKNHALALSEQKLRLLCYRTAAADDAPTDFLARMRWRLNLWEPQDRQLFNQTMAKAHIGLIAKYPEFKNAQF